MAYSPAKEDFFSTMRDCQEFIGACKNLPAMVRHEDERVSEMADEIVQFLAVGEASMATAQATKIRAALRGSSQKKPSSGKPESRSRVQMH
jgi:hypothetical protein